MWSSNDPYAGPYSPEKNDDDRSERRRLKAEIKLIERKIEFRRREGRSFSPQQRPVSARPGAAVSLSPIRQRSSTQQQHQQQQQQQGSMVASLQRELLSVLRTVKADFQNIRQQRQVSSSNTTGSGDEEQRSVVTVDTTASLQSEIQALLVSELATLRTDVQTSITQTLGDEMRTVIRQETDRLHQEMKSMLLLELANLQTNVLQASSSLEDKRPSFARTTTTKDESNDDEMKLFLRDETTSIKSDMRSIVLSEVHSLQAHLQDLIIQARKETIETLKGSFQTEMANLQTQLQGLHDNYKNNNNNNSSSNNTGMQALRGELLHQQQHAHDVQRKGLLETKRYIGDLVLQTQRDNETLRNLMVQQEEQRQKEMTELKTWMTACLVDSRQTGTATVAGRVEMIPNEHGDDQERVDDQRRGNPLDKDGQSRCAIPTRDEERDALLPTEACLAEHTEEILSHEGLGSQQEEECPSSKEELLPSDSGPIEETAVLDCAEEEAHSLDEDERISTGEEGAHCKDNSGDSVPLLVSNSEPDEEPSDTSLSEEEEEKELPVNLETSRRDSPDLLETDNLEFPEEEDSTRSESSSDTVDETNCEEDIDSAIEKSVEVSPESAPEESDSDSDSESDSETESSGSSCYESSDEEESDGEEPSESGNSSLVPAETLNLDDPAEVELRRRALAILGVGMVETTTRTGESSNADTPDERSEGHCSNSTEEDSTGSSSSEQPLRPEGVHLSVDPACQPANVDSSDSMVCSESKDGILSSTAISPTADLPTSEQTTVENGNEQNDKPVESVEGSSVTSESDGDESDITELDLSEDGFPAKSKTGMGTLAVDGGNEEEDLDAVFEIDCFLATGEENKEVATKSTAFLDGGSGHCSEKRYAISSEVGTSSSTPRLDDRAEDTPNTGDKHVQTPTVEQTTDSPKASVLVESETEVHPSKATDSKTQSNTEAFDKTYQKKEDNHFQTPDCAETEEAHENEVVDSASQFVEAAESEICGSKLRTLHGCGVAENEDDSVFSDIEAQETDGFDNHVEDDDSEVLDSEQQEIEVENVLDNTSRQSHHDDNESDISTSQKQEIKIDDESDASNSQSHGDGEEDSEVTESEDQEVTIDNDPHNTDGPSHDNGEEDSEITNSEGQEIAVEDRSDNTHSPSHDNGEEESEITNSEGQEIAVEDRSDNTDSPSHDDGEEDSEVTSNQGQEVEIDDDSDNTGGQSDDDGEEDAEVGSEGQGIAVEDGSGTTDRPSHDDGEEDSEATSSEGQEVEIDDDSDKTDSQSHSDEEEDSEFTGSEGQEVAIDDDSDSQSDEEGGDSEFATGEDQETSVDDGSDNTVSQSHGDGEEVVVDDDSDNTDSQSHSDGEEDSELNGSEGQEVVVDDDSDSTDSQSDEEGNDSEVSGTEGQELEVDDDSVAAGSQSDEEGDESEFSASEGQEVEVDDDSAVAGSQSDKEGDDSESSASEGQEVEVDDDSAVAGSQRDGEGDDSEFSASEGQEVEVYNEVKEVHDSEVGGSQSDEESDDSESSASEGLEVEGVHDSEVGGSQRDEESDDSESSASEGLEVEVDDDSAVGGSQSDEESDDSECSSREGQEVEVDDDSAVAGSQSHDEEEHLEVPGSVGPNEVDSAAKVTRDESQTMNVESWEVTKSEAHGIDVDADFEGSCHQSHDEDEDSKSEDQEVRKGDNSEVSSSGCHEEVDDYELSKNEGQEVDGDDFGVSNSESHGEDSEASDSEGRENERDDDPEESESTGRTMEGKDNCSGSRNENSISQSEVREVALEEVCAHTNNTSLECERGDFSEMSSTQKVVAGVEVDSINCSENTVGNRELLQVDLEADRGSPKVIEGSGGSEVPDGVGEESEEKSDSDGSADKGGDREQGDDPEPTHSEDEVSEDARASWSDSPGQTKVDPDDLAFVSSVLNDSKSSISASEGSEQEGLSRSSLSKEAWSTSDLHGSANSDDIEISSVSSYECSDGDDSSYYESSEEEESSSEEESDEDTSQNSDLVAAETLKIDDPEEMELRKKALAILGIGLVESDAPEGSSSSVSEDSEADEKSNEVSSEDEEEEDDDDDDGLSDDEEDETSESEEEVSRGVLRQSSFDESGSGWPPNRDRTMNNAISFSDKIETKEIPMRSEEEKKNSFYDKVDLKGFKEDDKRRKERKEMKKRSQIGIKTASDSMPSFWG